MANDPAQQYLDTLKTSPRARASAWDAVYAADDATAQKILDQLPFSSQVKADLWEIRNGASVEGGSAPTIARTEDFMDQETQEGSAASRFASNLGRMLNPVTAVKGIAGAIANPAETYRGMVDASAEQFGKAGEAWQQGRISEALAHGAAGALPVIGPTAANVGEQFAEGDVAGGLGATTGLLAPGIALGAMRGRLARQRATGRPDQLERAATQQVAERVLAPGNVSFRGRAQQIAPEVLRRGMRGSRDDLAAAAEDGMSQAGQRIDDAINAGGGPNSGVYIDPVVGQLQHRVNSLLINGEPIRGAEGRVAGLRARINQLQRTSKPEPQQPGLVPADTPIPPTRRALSFDDLRRFRDEQYRIANEARAYQRMGNPKLGDEAFAASEAGGAVRQEFARLSPEMAAANADYTFFKTLGDVLDPAQGRPKVSAPSQGVTGGAATSGAVAGSLIDPRAAFVMGVVRPWIQKMRSEPAWQLADAQSKMRLAEAIRNGDVTGAQKLMVRIGEGVTLTNPSESQSQTRGAAAR